MEELEDGPQAMPTQQGEAIGIQGGEVGAIESDGAVVGAIHAAEAVQQGGFAGAGGPGQGESLTTLE